MIPVGLVMTQEGFSSSVMDPLFIVHKALGPILLVVVLLRLAWRAFNPPPPLPASVPPLQRRAAATVHALLYVFLILMAVSGYVRVDDRRISAGTSERARHSTAVAQGGGVSEVAKTIHATAKYGLIALIGMHVAAAAYHGIVRRDGVFSRMWPPVAPKSSPIMGQMLSELRSRPRGAASLNALGILSSRLPPARRPPVSGRHSGCRMG